FLFGSHFWMFIIALIVQGFSGACIYTLGMTLVSDIFPEEKVGRQFLSQTAGIATGSVVGVLFHHFGYRAPFYFALSIATLDFILRALLVEKKIIQWNVQYHPPKKDPTMPIHLANIWGFNSSQIGLAYLAQVIPASLAQPIAGYLYDRIGAKILCFVAILFSSIAISLMGTPN
ncbi:major facilitator superfamily domain-containing protein, partial [Phascolomyces articulosus]